MIEFDWYISSYPILPPIGEFEWGARAIVKQIGTGRSDDSIMLAEHWGITEEQACDKAATDAKKWVANQGAV